MVKYLLCPIMTRAMSHAHSEKLDINPLANREARLEGELDMDNFERLEEAVIGFEGPVSYTLDFSLGVQRRPAVHGHIQGNMVMQCQRCMQPMAVLVASDVALGAICDDEMAQHLPVDLEPLQCDDWKFELKQLIEDELLLALPLAPLHLGDSCCDEDKAKPEIAVVKREERKKPFAGLGNLMKDLD